MCTAVSMGQFFGRTLDVEFSYNETVTVMPRGFPLSFRKMGTLNTHYAVCGMAFVCENYPLYYDAMNEKGLCMAGLNFPENCHYFAEHDTKENVASFELIPWVLAQCSSVDDAVTLLKRLNVWDEAFSPELPPSPLHWILADGERSVVVESCRDGLHIHDNPVGVLTNEPPFPRQLENLQAFSPHDRGLGLAGDGTSPARFQRAVYGKAHSPCESMSQFFHVMDLVTLPKGFAKVNGHDHYTVYTSCCDKAAGTYCCTTYENRQIFGIKLHACGLDGRQLLQFPLLSQEQIRWSSG